MSDEAHCLHPRRPATSISYASTGYDGSTWLDLERPKYGTVVVLCLVLLVIQYCILVSYQSEKLSSVMVFSRMRTAVYRSDPSV